MKKKCLLSLGIVIASLFASCSAEESSSSFFNNDESSSLDQGCGGFSGPLVAGYDVYLGKEWSYVNNGLIEKDDDDLCVGVSIRKRKEAKIQTFTLTSSTPLAIWYDLNNNGNIDIGESVYSLSNEPTVIDWVWNEEDETDNSAAALAGYCVDPHASKERVYKVKYEAPYREDIVLTMNDVIYTGEENNIYVESGKYPGEIHDPKTFTAYINNPEERITIDELSHDGFYNCKFRINDFDPIHHFVDVKNAVMDSSSRYVFNYTGLDGIITIVYEAHLPKRNPIKGEYNYKLHVNTPEDSVFFN